MFECIEVATTRPLEDSEGRVTSDLAPTSAIVTQFAGPDSARLGNSPPVSLALIGTQPRPVRSWPEPPSSGQVWYEPPEHAMSLLDAMTPRLFERSGALVLPAPDGAGVGSVRATARFAPVSAIRHIQERAVPPCALQVRYSYPAKGEGDSPLPRAGTANDARARPKGDHSWRSA